VKDPKPHITVIIPARNADDTIDRCLDALEVQSLPPDSYDVIVVDDGSSDMTRERVEGHPATLLLAQRREGAAAARNLGARQAQGSILLFTDADCEPEGCWVERMADPLEREGVSGAKGAYSSQQREVVARFVQLEYEDRYRRMAREEYIDFIDTYAAAYKREVFAEAGGFDPTLEVGEDQDLSFRLADQGHRMVFVPDARVVHWGHASSLLQYFRKKLRIGYWKATVTRRHPRKLIRDSHTPQVLKAQILLVGGGVLCLLGGLLWRPSWWAALTAGMVFLVSCLPFAGRSWGSDRVVALVSPLLLFARAVALGAGYCAGLVAGWLPRP
jgi:glycosyltransferase involved in cell wall biosynthesis